MSNVSGSSLSMRLFRYPQFVCIAVILLLGITRPSWALETDKNQPIRVQANSAEFNPNQGTAIYKGSVEIQQGSLKVLAEKVTVYRTPAGSIDKIIAESPKDPVHLQQQPNPEDPIVNAYAMKIHYQAELQQVDLTGNARLENGQDRFTGERILYHLQTRRIQAWGDTSDKASPTEDKGRVKIILYPANTENPQ